MKKCAICRAADADGRFHGKKLEVPICDRCAKIGSAFMAAGYIGFGMVSSPEELGGSSLIDSLLRNLRNRGLVEEEDVKEVKGGNVLQVNGCTVSAPVCRVCGSDRDIIVKDFDDGSWAYYCTRCDRVIPFEEFREGNP